MNTHKGARLSPYSRALLVKRITCEGLRAEEAAQAAGVSVRTAYKWLQRFRKDGPSGLIPRLASFGLPSCQDSRLLTFVRVAPTP